MSRCSVWNDQREERNTIMQDFWRQLKAEIEKLAPDLLRTFRPGADDHAIAQAEQRLGMILPEEVKAFFRGHNGSDGACFGYWVFLSLDAVCDAWLMLKEQDPSAQFVGSGDSLSRWNKSWLPLLRVEPDGPFMFIKLEQLDGVMQPGCVFLHGDMEYYPWIKSRAWNEFLE